MRMSINEEKALLEGRGFRPSSLMTNFGIGWETTPSFPPQLVYSQTLGFVPGSSDMFRYSVPI
jgi:hypothetical protein